MCLGDPKKFYYFGADDDRVGYAGWGYGDLGAEYGKYYMDTQCGQRVFENEDLIFVCENCYTHKIHEHLKFGAYDPLDASWPYDK